MLSPGILFPMGYLLLYLSTNIFLNDKYKKDLTRSFNHETGNSRQISIKSLKAGFIFDSVTLNQIELTSASPSHAAKSRTGEKTTINCMKIPSPNLQKLLYSRSEIQASTKNICKLILAEEHRNQ